MRVAFVSFLVAASALAQNPNANLPQACGPADAHFEISLEKAEHKQFQPEPGKSLVYFINQQGTHASQNEWVFPKVLLGVDGRWVGAYRDSSYFPVRVEPGEHRVCAWLQSHAEDQVEVLRFTAEAGKAYYFRTRDISPAGTNYLLFDAIDSDEATYRIALYPLALQRQR
jgi:hypothetical protein